MLWNLLQESDRRSSVDEIWTLGHSGCGGVTVFYYTSTLATWFFGLNLVRFEHTTGGGQSLEII